MEALGRIFKDVLPIVTLILGVTIGSVVQDRRERRARIRKGIEEIWRSAQRALDALESMKMLWTHLKPTTYEQNESTRFKIHEAFSTFQQNLSTMEIHVLLDVAPPIQHSARAAIGALGTYRKAIEERDAEGMKNGLESALGEVTKLKLASETFVREHRL